MNNVNTTLERYVVKLNQHTEMIKEWMEDDYVIVDVDGNKIEFEETPDYTLILKFDKKMGFMWKLFPKDFDIFEDEFWVWVSDSPMPIEYILKDIKKEEKVDILSVNEVQKRLYKN